MNEVCIHVVMEMNRMMGVTVFFIICIILVIEMQDSPKAIRETTSFRS